MKTHSSALIAFLSGAVAAAAITISSPANGARLALGENISVSVDTGGQSDTISKVEFFNEGAKIGESTMAPFDFVRPSPPPGEYSLTAKATYTNASTAVSPEVLVSVGDPSARVLFVVGNANALNASELDIRARLEAFGMDVAIVNAAASTTADAAGMDLLLMSGTITTDVGTKFRNVAVPVVNWNPALEDDFLMTLGTVGVDYGETGGQTSVVITDPNHPLAAGLSAGTHVVLNPTGTMVWGQPAGSASVIARLDNGGVTGHPCFYGYDSGALLIDGVTHASARRVNLFLHAGDFESLTEEGLRLFDAAISWALDRDLAPQITHMGIRNGQVEIVWEGGGGLQLATGLSSGSPWTDLGWGWHYADPVGPGSRFYRVVRQPTRVSIQGNKWYINGAVTYPGSAAEGRLMNVRMVNSVFEDLSGQVPPFDPEANADNFIAHIPFYVASGVRAFTINLQGGTPGYENAINSALASDGSLRSEYMARVRRVIEACDRQGAVVILGCFYQRQIGILADTNAVRAAVTNTVGWIQQRGFKNVVLEIANEYSVGGGYTNYPLIGTSSGEVQLIQLAKQYAPGLLVSTSGKGDGLMPTSIAHASDFILIHFNNLTVSQIPARIQALTSFGKPIICNEDDRTGLDAVSAGQASITNSCSYGLMLYTLNQSYPFEFHGAADDTVFYPWLNQVAAP